MFSSEDLVKAVFRAKAYILLTFLFVYHQRAISRNILQRQQRFINSCNFICVTFSRCDDTLYLCHIFQDCSILEVRIPLYLSHFLGFFNLRCEDRLYLCHIFQDFSILEVSIHFICVTFSRTFQYGSEDTHFILLHNLYKVVYQVYVKKDFV